MDSDVIDSALRDGWLDRQCRIAKRQMESIDECDRKCRQIVVEEFAKDGIEVER